MPNQWYYQVMGEVLGPVSASELKRLAKEGPVTNDSLVRSGEQGDWIHADRVKGLLDDAVRGENGGQAGQRPSRAEGDVISVRCSCGKSFKVDAKHAGKRGRCQNCGRELLIPEATPGADVAGHVSPIAALVKDDAVLAKSSKPDCGSERESTPTDSECLFCGKRASNKESALACGMQKAVHVKGNNTAHKAALLLGGAVGGMLVPGDHYEDKFRTVKVPRCTQCKRAHDDRAALVANTKEMTLILWGCLLGAILGSVVVLVGWGLTTYVVGGAAVGGSLGVLFIVVYAKVTGLAFRREPLPPGIRPVADWEQYPKVQKLHDKGWH